ncbi:MAG: ComF family protein [Balneolaceae bacterium]|nr:ComF family protein [Balneolaceae bacterium]
MIKSTIHFLASITSGLAGIVFPDVCICCGLEVTDAGKMICTFCLLERFEDANPENRLQSAAELLPEGVSAQHALWRFDKGGVLQDLMHKLKYERLTDIGRQMGRQLARRTIEHPRIASKVDQYRGNALLVPVPLHYRKQRQRGYNQAFVIAEGMEQVMNMPICSIKDVVRQKNTKSQTGFDLQKRNANMKNAFSVNNPARFSNKLVILVDDVFTTGSTSFELSGELLSAGASEVIILTVAEA